MMPSGSGIADRRWRGRPRDDGSPPDPRFSLANERTFLAWNRTALALVGGGLAAAQLLRFGFAGGRLIVGLPLIGLGGAAGITGIARWRRSERAMRRRVALPRSRLAPALIGVGTAVVALVSLVLLIVDQMA